MPGQETSLKRNDAATLAPKNTALLVGDLERLLLREMPAQDACSWDRTGMLVGNPLEVVQGVAIALDPTLPAIKAAKQSGANVLVTHHPVFLDPPTSFVPASIQGHTPGAVVRYACEQGMSIMSFPNRSMITPASRLSTRSFTVFSFPPNIPKLFFA